MSIVFKLFYMMSSPNKITPSRLSGRMVLIIITIFFSQLAVAQGGIVIERGNADRVKDEIWELNRQKGYEDVFREYQLKATQQEKALGDALEKMRREMQAKEAQQRRQQQNAQRNQQEKQQREQRAAELEAKREQERIERERRRAEEERQRQIKFQNDYNAAISRTNGYYSQKKGEVEWMASRDALDEMYSSMSQTRLRMGIEDVSVISAPPKQSSTSKGLERMKKRRENKEVSLLSLDEASLFALSSITPSALKSSNVDNWPYASRIPITQREQQSLFTYANENEEYYNALLLDNFENSLWKGLPDDGFASSIQSMTKEELNYQELVYREYSEYLDLSDYSYHNEKTELPEGWVDFSRENKKVKEICNDAEMLDSKTPSGLKMSVLKKGDKYVISFGGTDFPEEMTLSELQEFYRDAKTDLNGMFEENEQQVARAYRAVQQLISEAGIPLEKVEFTGHSLGGRLAATMSVRYSRPATTFNAAGPDEETKKQYDYLMSHAKNYLGIRNVVTQHDIVTNLQEIGSGAKNPYIRALPKEQITIAHETVSGTLSSPEGKIARNALNMAGPLGVSAGKGLDKANKTLEVVDKVNIYFNRDYRALGATITLPDGKSWTSPKDPLQAHKITEMRSAINGRRDLIQTELQNREE